MTDYHQDDAKLVAALNSVRDAARNCLQHYANQERLGTWLAKPSPDMPEITTPVLIEMSAHSRFGNGSSKFFGPKQLMLHPQYQVGNLVKVAVDRNGDDAVAWYHKLFSIEETDLRYVAEIYGLMVAEQLTLSNGVSLMPLVQLPPSPNATAIQAQFHIRPGGPNISTPLPIGAIWEKQRVQVLPNHKEGATPRSDELERTIRAFTLMDGAAPLVGVSWVEFVDADLAMGEVGRMFMGARYDGQKAFWPLDIDAVAIEWVERYLKLDSDVRTSCDIAIDRLNLARRRISPGNQAIEGGICLEALLLTDNENQEVNYRLRLRAALLLASDLEERRKISNEIRDFYSLRSMTVHGSSGKAKDALKHQECAERGLSICARALKAIVIQNKKFDPEAWELSGGKQNNLKELQNIESSDNNSGLKVENNHWRA